MWPGERGSKYSPELRERAVRLVQEHTGEHGSQWGQVRWREARMQHRRVAPLAGVRSLRKTSSTQSANLWSRSRIRNRIGSERSANAHDTWRACWMTHSALGFAVHPAACTRRLPNSMKKRTYTRCSQIVSTVTKSTAKSSSRKTALN
jgi:hypothetical protein